MKHVLWVLLFCCAARPSAAQGERKQVVPAINTGTAPLAGTTSLAEPPVHCDAAILRSIKPEVKVDGHTYPGAAACFLLNDAVQSWKSKPGRRVKARLTAPLRLPTGLTVPAGTLLEGEIEQVVEHGHGSPYSTVTFHFSRLKEKDGTEVPVLGRLAAATKPLAVPSNTAGKPGKARSGDFLTQDTHPIEQARYQEARYQVAREIGPGAIIAEGESLEILEDSKLFVVLAPKSSGSH